MALPGQGSSLRLRFGLVADAINNVFTYAHTHAYIYNIYIYIHTHIYIYTCTYIYNVYIYIYLYILFYLCIYIYTVLTPYRAAHSKVEELHERVEMR